jgi:hypothetical protein
MLELSTSAHSNTTNDHRLENSLAESFRLLSMLKFTSNDESVMLERLRDKLQKDYGPSKFTTLEELDKQYCFSKTMDIGVGCQKKQQDRYPLKRPSKKCVTSKPYEERESKESPLFRNKINMMRNNSCASLQQYSARKEDKSKVRRKKHNSMENLAVLSVKEPRMVLARDPKEMEIKRKIMGMKEQIKREKELLIKRT